MQNSQDNEKLKRNVRKMGLIKTSKSQAEGSQERAIKKPKPPTLRSEPTAVSMGPVLSQEEFRARVARKAFELFEKRQALTEVDDWVEAERLVKLQLLSEQHGASI